MKLSSPSLLAVAVAAAAFLPNIVVNAAAFEWAGAFPMNDDSHTWSMQKVGGAYADPSMRLVLVGVATPDQAAIEANEAAATTLIASTDGSCTKIEEGETMGPISDDLECYELHVDDAKDDSLFPMTTTGLSGLVVYAQHFPIEFERDQHYLKDSSGADVEPVAQEGGEGDDYAHDHGHDDHGDEEDEPKESCACVAAEYGFQIDCSATAAMIDAINFMKGAGCAADCGVENNIKECQESWYIVQAHHDYCPVDGLPSEIEDDFHDFDEVCKSCAIVRQFQEGKPDCPAANCDDNSGDEAYAALVEDGTCSTDCTTDACSNNYLTLRLVHDDCPHDTISTASEEGIHDFEDVCSAVACNTPESKEDQLTCPTTTPPVESDGSSSDAIVATGIATAALVGTAAALLLV